MTTVVNSSEFLFGGDIRYFVFILFFTFGFSETILVPDEYPTIQSGIDASMSGDSVLVGPGTYNESINYNGKKNSSNIYRWNQ